MLSPSFIKRRGRTAAIAFLLLSLMVTSSVLQVGAVPVKPGDGNTSAATATNSDDLLTIIPTRTSVSSSMPSLSDPEKPAISTNGPLPSGTPAKDGRAIEATTYPDSVTKAMEGAFSKVAGIRLASTQEIQELTYYATLSANSYCRTVIPGGKWDCPHCSATEGLKIIDTFSTFVYDTNVLVARGDSEKTVYVAFRGSNSFRNAIADIEFNLVSYPPVNGTKVHDGFLDSYKEIQDKLVATIFDQLDKYPRYKVAVTGHSLGGATALLCALDLYQRNKNFTQENLFLHTQGQPRVGNPAFAKYVANADFTYKRTIHERDLVPHIPPASFGYLHAGEEFWITDDDPVAIRVCESHFETPMCSNSIVPFTSIIDHLTYFGINMGLCL